MPNKNLLNIAFLFMTSLLACSCENNENHNVVFSPLSYSQWQQTLRSYQAKIVVVDVWATWCAPCLEKFPKMVKLHQKYNKHSIQFVSMNVDDHKDQKSLDKAKSFLQKMDAEFDHYWMNENLTDSFKYLQLNSIPAVIIYDQDGKERHRLSSDDPSNLFTINDVATAIEQLLGH